MSDDVRDVELDFEPEDELGTLGAVKAKLAKLKDELESVKKERAEYLDGWQRCKADSVNTRRDGLLATEQASARATERVIEEIIPVVDSFDMAMQGDAWLTIDKNWRIGVESIAKQLLGALESAGALHFGERGDAYDPSLHDVVQEIEGGASNTIAQIIRRGWKRNERILRPAQVILYK